MKLYLPNIYEEWNRRRGDGEKIPALCVMIFSFIVYMAVAQLPLLLVNWKYALYHFAAVALSVAVSTLFIFMWVWGSKYWHHGRDTSKEKGFVLAERYADSKVLRNPYSIVWKDHAFNYLCRYKYTVGYAMIGVICLNPLMPLIGWLYGEKIAHMYQHEFKTPDDHILERAEKRTGKLSGQMAMGVAGLHLLFNLIFLGWSLWH